MINYDYIEDAGQYYWQCVVEINNIQLVDPVLLLNIPNVMKITNKRISGKRIVINFLN
jgi:hypothetical protein